MTSHSEETVQKMEKVVKLTAAIERAQAQLAENPSPKTALQIQKLQQQRANLQATMRPHLVA